MCYMKRKWKYAQLTIHNTTEIVKNIILLMISNGKKWNYLGIKKSSPLLREITSKHNGDFYCFNCLHSFKAENKLKLKL